MRSPNRWIFGVWELLDVWIFGFLDVWMFGRFLLIVKNSYTKSPKPNNPKIK